MTLYEFKQELYIVRDNRRVMRSLRTSLANLEEDILTSVFSGAIDYSKEKVQHQSDPDSAIINAIMLTEKEKERLRKQLQELQDENAELEQLIYRQRGLGAEIVRLYFIEGKTMKEVAYFVARKLAPIEYVTATSTHFVLKTYKDKGVVYTTPKIDPRDNTCI